MFTWVYRETHEESQSNRKGSQWALYNGSVPTDPLYTLPTESQSWMGYRIAPCNTSESIS